MNASSCLLVEPHECPEPIEDIPAGEEPEQFAVLAGGCFWCTEAVFRKLQGVREVLPGYAGGDAETANYQAVCSGSTGHAEAVRIRFDARRITYGGLLKIFFSIAHDPTQLNRQGADQGTQYRSAIFPVDEAQRRVAQAYLQQLESSGLFSSPIVTTLEPLKDFFPAEEYHQNYAVRNPRQPYIVQVAQPKVDKLQRYYASLVREKPDAPPGD